MLSSENFLQPEDGSVKSSSYNWPLDKDGGTDESGVLPAGEEGIALEEAEGVDAAGGKDVEGFPCPCGCRPKPPTKKITPIIARAPITLPTIINKGVALFRSLALRTVGLDGGSTILAELSFPPASRTWIVSASLCRWLSRGSVNASSQCEELTKYSIDFDSTTFSMRKGMIGIPLLTALSTSRSTCGEVFELLENTKTMRRLWFSPFMRASAYGTPGNTSLGAIQQRIPLLSRFAHTVSATTLS